MPYSCNRSSRSSLDAVASTSDAPAALASWMAARPTPLAPAWISTDSPACRWPNSNRQSSAVPNSIGTAAASSIDSPSGMANTSRRRHAGQLGVAAGTHGGDDGLADDEVAHAVADLPDRPGGLVADDVRDRGQLAAGSVQEVAALDGDGPDLEDDPARPQLRIGHVHVLEHLGPTSGREYAAAFTPGATGP